VVASASSPLRRINPLTEFIHSVGCPLLRLILAKLEQSPKRRSGRQLTMTIERAAELIEAIQQAIVAMPSQQITARLHRQPKRNDSPRPDSISDEAVDLDG
jgi:hypothetical protein